jgi:hypothetical protein
MAVIDTMFIRANAQKILDASTVGYLKSATLRGSLFEETADPGIISSIYCDTGFLLNRQEPLEVVEHYKKAGRWCLGKLIDGHHFIILLPLRC